MTFEMEKANDAEPTPTLSTADDLSVPVPGLSLDLTRTYVQSISGRYQLGAFGRGWTFQGDDSASIDATSGDVTILEGGATRTFTKQSNGSYAGEPGDAATLTITAGYVSVRETDGTVETFNPNGTFHSETDLDGNTILATYTGPLLTSLSHTGGASLHFTYNAQGRIVSAVASTGQTVNYTYDPSGEYLLTASGPDGSVSYTYATAQTNPALQHAALIDHPSRRYSHLFQL